MELGGSPRQVTSKHRVVYRRSAWTVHEFDVKGAAGEPVCRGAVLRVQGSVLAWAGRGARLAELALAVAVAAPNGAVATPLLAGAADAAPQLARRLAARLRLPVYVALGDSFDRFTLPLVERALVAEIKGRPNHTKDAVTD